MASQMGPPTISVEEIVREFFSDMKKELNTKRISDVLFAKGLIDFDLKKNIDREANQVDANELLLSHLIRNGTLETLRRFCEVLEETAKSHSLPHHKAWSNKLKQKLTKVGCHKPPHTRTHAIIYTSNSNLWPVYVICVIFALMLGFVVCMLLAFESSWYCSLPDMYYL